MSLGIKIKMKKILPEATSNLSVGVVMFALLHSVDSGQSTESDGRDSTSLLSRHKYQQMRRMAEWQVSQTDPPITHIMGKYLYTTIDINH